MQAVGQTVHRNARGDQRYHSDADDDGGEEEGAGEGEEEEEEEEDDEESRGASRAEQNQKAHPSEALVAAALATVDDPLGVLNYGRCPRHSLCVRGARHPGLCRHVGASARCVHRVLAKYTSHGRYASSTYLLVQYQDRSREDAVWTPAFSVLDDVAVWRYEMAASALLQEGDEGDEGGEGAAARAVEAYDDEVLLLPPLAGEEDVPMPPPPPRKPPPAAKPSPPPASQAAGRSADGGTSAKGALGSVGEEGGEEDNDDGNIYDAKGRKLCNTFGCTLLNNHYGLHKLPAASQEAGRQRRTSSQKINFRSLVAGTAPALKQEIGQGRQLGQPDSFYLKRREHEERLAELADSAFRPHAALDGLIGGKDLADVVDVDDDGEYDEYDDGEEEEEASTLKRPDGVAHSVKPNKSTTFGIGSRVRYLRAGTSQGCNGTIVDAKCGYWVVSIDGGPRAPVYARGSMIEPIDKSGNVVSPPASGGGRSESPATSPEEVARDPVRRAAEGQLYATAATGPYQCGKCGRQLANAGSFANHTRACTGTGRGSGGGAPLPGYLPAGKAVSASRPANNRKPVGGQCRRNPRCLRGLRHCGLGGPCRMQPEGSSSADVAPPKAERRRGKAAEVVYEVCHRQPHWDPLYAPLHGLATTKPQPSHVPRCMALT